MTGPTPPVDWRQLGLAALAGLNLEQMPSFEIIYLDSVAVYTMSSGPLEQPFTVEHGSYVVSCVLRAMADSARYRPERHPEVGPDADFARDRVVTGAHALAAKGWPGLRQLVNRLVPAVIGELELHHESPEQQSQSLFRFGLLAVASGTANLVSSQAADGIEQLLVGWDAEIGAGFVPPWRLATA